MLSRYIAASFAIALACALDVRGQQSSAPEGVELRLAVPATRTSAPTPNMAPVQPQAHSPAQPIAPRVPTQPVRYQAPVPETTLPERPTRLQPEPAPQPVAPYEPNNLPPAESLPASAAPTPAAGLQMADLESRAMTANPAVAAAAARVRAARGRWVQAGLYPNPVASYAADDVGNNGRAGMHGMFVRQEIVTNNKLGLARAAANQEITQAEQQLAAAQFQVQNDVRGAFYETLISQHQFELARGPLTQVATEGVRTAEALLRAQEVSRIDVLQAGIEADRTRIAAAQAGRRHAAAWRRLAAVSGDPSLAMAPLAGDPRSGLKNRTWPEVRGRTLTGSPQLAAAAAHIEQARWRVQQACAERCPNVEVEFGSQYDFDTLDTVAGAQLSIPVPIHNRNQGNIRAAQAELAESQAEYRRRELALEHELAAVFESYETAREDVNRHAADILPRAQEALNLVRAGYQQGELSYMTLLSAQRTWIEAQMTYFNALRQLRAADISLEGFLLKDSLRSEK